MDPDASTLEGLLATASSRDAAARAELQQKIQELPSAEQGNLWRAVFSRLTTTVLQVVSEEASEEGCLPLVAICQAAANAGIVCNNLVNTVQFLNGMTSMLEQGALLNSIHDLCVVWCTKKLSEWKQLWLNTFTRVFEQSLMKLSKVKIDKLITTVFIMKDGLATDEITAVQLTAAEQEDLNGHLSKCAASTNYLDRPKGRKFVTFLLTLDKSLARAMYKAMDQALPFMTSAFIEVLAQIYLSAWKEVTGKPQAVVLSVESRAPTLLKHRRSSAGS